MLYAFFILGLGNGKGNGEGNAEIKLLDEEGKTTK